MSAPGTRLRAWAIRYCPPVAIEHLIDPLIADMQWEYADAVARGDAWGTRRALAAGYWAFWRVVVRHAPIWSAQCAHRWAADGDWAVVRAIGYALLALTLLTAALLAPPLLSMRARQQLSVWLVVTVLPQAMALSVPVGVLVGTLCGLHGRLVTPRIRRGILALGLVVSAVMLATIGWVIPEANQAFRVAVAGRHIERGAAELPVQTLREQALTMKSAGQRWGSGPELVRAGKLFVDYHSRWAIAAAALVLSIFALGVTALRVGGVATTLMGSLAPAVYLAYLFELGSVQNPLLSHETIAVVLAWLPNIVLALTGAAFLRAHDDRRMPQR